MNNNMFFLFFTNAYITFVSLHVSSYLNFKVDFFIYTIGNLQSSNPPFTSVELDHSDSGREGCTVTTLTVTAEPINWRSAIKVAVQEVCVA